MCQTSRTRDAWVIQGPPLDRPEQELRYSEISHQPLFRRIQLPAEIDLDHISACADRGLLQIHAAKAVSQPRELTATAAAA